MAIKIKETKFSQLLNPADGYLLFGVDSEDGNKIKIKKSDGYTEILQTVVTGDASGDSIVIGSISGGTYGERYLANGLNVWPLSNFSQVAGNASKAAGDYSYAAGYKCTTTGIYSRATGEYTLAAGEASISGGLGKELFNVKATGKASFNISSTISKISDVASDYSSILGGYDNVININSNNAAILGGNNNTINGINNIILGGANNMTSNGSASCAIIASTNCTISANITNSTIIGCVGLTGNINNTTFMNNIRSNNIINANTFSTSELSVSGDINLYDNSYIYLDFNGEHYIQCDFNNDNIIYYGLKHTFYSPSDNYVELNNGTITNTGNIFTNRIFTTVNSAAYPAYSFQGQTSTGLYHHSQGVSISISGLEYFRFDINGDFSAYRNIIGYYGTFSDARLKKDIINLSNPLDIILKTNGVSYNLIENNKPHFGYIAQEIEKILPNIITEHYMVGNDDTLYKSINYQEIIPFITEAIKEQQNIIENQQKTIESQQKLIERILKKIDLL